MRLFGLVACAVMVSAVSCGSGNAPAGPMDASLDAPTDAPTRDAGPDAAPIDARVDVSPADAPFDAPGTISSACDNMGLLAGCVVGACTVSATGRPLPNGGSLTVTQKPVPPGLNGDTLGSVLCSIALSD